MTPIERFTALVTQKPLYPSQAEIANAILNSINNNEGAILTVMMSRQSGKNQRSAMIEAFWPFPPKDGIPIQVVPIFSHSLITRMGRFYRCSMPIPFNVASGPNHSQQK
jgi:hypothetical protein